MLTEPTGSRGHRLIRFCLNPVQEAAFGPLINNSKQSANECPELVVLRLQRVSPAQNGCCVSDPAPFASCSLIILILHVDCLDHSSSEGRPSGLFCRKLFGVIICTCMCLSTFYCRFVNKVVSIFIQTYCCRCHAFSPCDC